MPSAVDTVQDVMQVCRNGHVITDLLRSCPDRGRSHCERCGAATLDRCGTCGRELPGAIYVGGMLPVGGSRPPHFCPACGAAFPWTDRPRPAAEEPVARLEKLLRRLPGVVRQLRWRQGEQPPFRVEDERDLEDLVRALLPILFDDIRPESRTPHYSPGTRTDFLLPAESVALTVKLARPGLRVPQLAEQVREDADYHRQRGVCRTLVVLVHDPEGLLREPGVTETAWSSSADDFEVRCVIATP